jgi:hypothetical protein
MNEFQYRDPPPSWVVTNNFTAYEDTSLTTYKKVYPEEILLSVAYFQEYPEANTPIPYQEFKNHPVKYANVSLQQSDFAHGTVRLSTPAHYVLTEDIVFEPNPDDNWMPTPAQTAGGAHAQYPVAPFGGYHLGFFAAITVEGEDIFLDLNGKVIRQSLVFSVQQRFFAVVELANTPFIPTQGPANFGDVFKPAKNCLVANGTLGLSSHHGIHGNGMTKVIMQNLRIEQFEVAGIALNGGENCLIRNVQICNMSNDITVLSTYSSARFMEPVLAQIVAEQPQASLEFAQSGTKTGSEVLAELRAKMDQVLTATRERLPVPDGLFKNTSGLYDGGGYGIVLNSLGVVVNGFKKNREGAIGNVNNVVHDVKIQSCATGQGEIIGISVPASSAGSGAYGKKVQVGMAGDVFQVDVVTDDNGTYIGNVLSNAKLFLAKFGVGPQRGTVNITDSVIDWALAEEPNLDQILIDNGLYFVSGGDSMAHIMKGFIGLFISAGKQIIAFNNDIIKLDNKGQPGVVNREETTKAAIIPLEEIYNGAATRGIAITGSESVFIKETRVRDVSSECGIGCGLDLLNTNTQITANQSISISNIQSCRVFDKRGAPNPSPMRSVFVGISEDTSALI